MGAIPRFFIVTRRDDVSSDIFDVVVHVGFVGETTTQTRWRDALAEVDLDADVDAAARRRRLRDVVFGDVFVSRAAAQVVDTCWSVIRRRKDYLILRLSTALIK